MEASKLYIENRMAFPVYVLLRAEDGELDIHVHGRPHGNAVEIGPNMCQAFEADAVMRSCYDRRNRLSYTIHAHGCTIMFVGGADRYPDGPIFSIRDPRN